MSSNTSKINPMEFLELAQGKHCAESTCHQLDFLPFKCAYCQLHFCSDHYRANAGHACPSFDRTTSQTQIPVCPLCQQSVNIPSGSDPNGPMDAHLTNECPVLLPSGPAKKKPPNTCAARRCTTKLTALKIHCDECSRDFCATHRFPRDHLCKGAQAKPAPKSSASATLTASRRSVSKSGLAAIARVRNAANAASKSPSSSSPTLIEITSDSSDSDVEFVGQHKAGYRAVHQGDPKTSDQATKFSLSAQSALQKLSPANIQTSKRATEERKSQLKGLAVRAQKGLLSEQEKVHYATLQAMDAKQGNKAKSECIVL